MAMSDVTTSVHGGIILRGRDTVYAKNNLLKSMLFDRIINLQFFRRHDGQGDERNPISFTLRSDYEGVIGSKGTFSIQKCRYKPSIKISYKQLPGGTAINVKILVSNMHSYSLEGNGNGTYSNSKNPIRRIVAQLGYFSQFPNFNDMQRNNLTRDDFFNLTAQGAYPNSVQTLDLLVLAQYPVNNPPDAEMCFDCVVGSVDEGFHPVGGQEIQGDISLKAYMHEVITRHYPKKPLPPKYAALDRGSLMPEGSEVLREYGTRVFLSPAASNISFAKGKPPVVPEHYKSVSTALAFITKNIDSELRFLPLISGDYVVYVNGEDPYDVIHSEGLRDIVGETITLPAVYKITYGGTRTIQCMFSKDIRPFMKIDFSTTYNLANLVGFFYTPGDGNYSFLPIIMTVNFATVEDINMIEMMSVDDEKKGS